MQSGTLRFVGKINGLELSFGRGSGLLSSVTMRLNCNWVGLGFRLITELEHHAIRDLEVCGE